MQCVDLPNHNIRNDLIVTFFVFLFEFSLLILGWGGDLWRKMAGFEINSLKFRVYQGFVMDVEYR